MKLLRNTPQISIVLIGIFFITTFGWISLKDILLHFFAQEFDSQFSNRNEAHWEMVHTKTLGILKDTPCDITYPIFLSGSSHISSGEHLFKAILKNESENVPLQDCVGEIDRPVFRDDGWGYSSGSLILTFSGGVTSAFNLDLAFDTGGYLLENDHDFHINSHDLTYDLSPYFGKNIVATLEEKIRQMNAQGRVIATSDHERILFFRKPPVVSWPSDWQEIRFVGSKDAWHIVLPSNLTRRYKIENSFVRPDVPEKTLSITFDDGPSKEYTPILLDILKSHHVKATFCVLGSQAIKYPELVRRIYEGGHEICNHSVTHSSFTSIGIMQVQDEIVRNEKIINDILGMSMTLSFVRPPYGAISLDMERELNTPFALWSVDTLDWKDQRPKSIMNRASVARSGDIVLFHDIHPGAIKMLDAYITKYQSDGYIFTTLSQIIDSGSLSNISGQSLFRSHMTRYSRITK
ncbi:MAG: polysaccharide deacetylase family protein [Candidatus Gracilibacteria bacterium]